MKTENAVNIGILAAFGVGLYLVWSYLKPGDNPFVGIGQNLREGWEEFLRKFRAPYDPITPQEATDFTAIVGDPSGSLQPLLDALQAFRDAAGQTFTGDPLPGFDGVYVVPPYQGQDNTPTPSATPPAEVDATIQHIRDLVAQMGYFTAPQPIPHRPGWTFWYDVQPGGSEPFVQLGQGGVILEGRPAQCILNGGTWWPNNPQADPTGCLYGEA